MNQMYPFTICILYFQVDGEMQHLKYSLIFLTHLLPSFKDNREKINKQ